MAYEKHIIGIDFGTAYTYIVACKEILENGVKKLTAFKRLTPFGDYKTGTRSLLERNEAGELAVPKEKKDGGQIKVKDRLFKSVIGKSDTKDDFAEYVDADYEVSKDPEQVKSHPDTTTYFELLFSEILKNEAKYLQDVESVEFIIGTPPGYKKAYAEELKRCVKNGFLRARKRYNSASVKLKSACYPEPVLAGYAWLGKDKTESGLKNNEDCLVVDIGAGTVDFAFLTRTNNVINAKKFDDDGEGGKRICCSGTNENERIAGDDQDKAISKDYLEKYGIEISENDACKIKEGLHRSKRENESDEQYLVWKDGRNRISEEGGILSFIGKNPTLDKEPLKANEKDIIDFGELQTGDTSLNSIYQRVAEVIDDYLSQYKILKGKKLLFIGGSSNVDKLKEIVCHKLDDNYGFKHCDTIALASEQSKELEIQLTHASAVAIGACLAHDRDELIVTPPLRIYMKRSAISEDDFEMHTLINEKGVCTGPIAFTSEELKRFGTTIEFFFREGGALKSLDGKSAVEELDIELTYKKTRTGEKAKFGGKEVVDNGERFPLNEYNKVKIEQNKGVSLIIFASKHGLDLGKSFVYFIKKVGDVGDCDALELEILDAQLTKLTGEETTLSLEIEDPSTDDERQFNESSFCINESVDGYNIACYKIGVAHKRVLDEKLLEEVDPDTDDYQYVRIFNKKWKQD